MFTSLATAAVENVLAKSLERSLIHSPRWRTPNVADP